LIPISTHFKGKIVLTLFSEFFSFLPQKTNFRAGRHKNKEKHLVYLGHRILLLIQNPLLQIENPKNPKNQKSTPPTA
jgi:hypothetical protein